eukprot:TRINITY_DN2053_c0_g1_i3.p1 TRINITY_DN2053_c0_g1~~TRINITY_DN2053_c0_g1_i3.p1  ORF type:complete len:184 (-),score=34.02 TRINITY_DN2053_c0_g1_i3:33-584(-)
MSQKKKSLSQHSKARDHFFELCFNELLKVDFEKVKAVVIASPGFVKDEFFEIVQQKFQKEEYSKLKQYIPKFLPVHSSNGYLDALNEVLQDEKIKFKLKDTKALSEIKALESFYEAMKNDADKVAYGPKYVIEANENNCLLYTSDAADEEDSVDLGGRRIVKKKKTGTITRNVVDSILKQKTS